MRKGMPKMAQPASKVSPDGPKSAHLEPLLPTLEALLATWGVALLLPTSTTSQINSCHLGHSFTHFFAFLLPFHGQ